MKRTPKTPQNRRNLLRTFIVCALISTALMVPASAQTSSTHSKTETAALRIRVKVVPVVLPPGKRKKDDASVSYIMDMHPAQIEVSEETQTLREVSTGRIVVLKTTTVVPK